jgi:DNA anti-recombination protein RmuC
MKAILEFDRINEEHEFQVASKATALYRSLSELDDLLRKYQKYGHNFETANQAIASIRQELREIMEDRGLNLEAMR